MLNNNYMYQFGKKLILYGAGVIGSRLLMQLVAVGVPVECVCDSSEEKHGTEMYGHKIIGPQDILRRYEHGSFEILIALKKQTAQAVRQDLISRYGLAEDDFYDETHDAAAASRLLNRLQDEIEGMERNREETYQKYFDKVQKNFIELTEEKKEELRRFILAELGPDYVDYFAFERMEMLQRNVIPWLESLHALKGARILEVGHGEGICTTALCEQGADVTAIDLFENPRRLTQKRLGFYGLQARLIECNAVNIDQIEGDFDFIIYPASLEHMTSGERIETLQKAFNRLRPGQYLVVLDTPNRLNYWDSHTTYASFFHWLPDDVAAQYRKFTTGTRMPSTKAQCGKQADKLTDQMMTLIRDGRGVSFHEFDLALGGRDRFTVAGRLSDFMGKPENAYQKMIKAFGPPGLHKAFYEEALDLAIGMEMD